MSKISFYNFLLVALLMFSACSTVGELSGRSEKDASLEVSPEQYSMRRLEGQSSTGNAFWGIPSGSRSQKQELIFKLNGIEFNSNSKVLPSLSLFGLTLVAGVVIDEFVFTKPVIGNSGAADFLLSSVVALPVAGAINNKLWAHAAVSSAIYNVNNRLVEQNPDVDVILFPKYRFRINSGLWSQQAEVNVNAVGARLNDESANVATTPPVGNTVAQPHHIENSDVSKVVVTPEQARDRMEQNFFKKSDRVRFKIKLNTRSTRGEVEIPEGVVYDVKRENVYINFKYENRDRRTVKNFREVQYSYSQLLENYPLSSEGERILHSYKVGDEVSFKARIVIPDMVGNFDIPKGKIIRIDGNHLIIEFPFLRYELTTKKHFSEVKLLSL